MTYTKTSEEHQEKNNGPILCGNVRVFLSQQGKHRQAWTACQLRFTLILSCMVYGLCRIIFLYFSFFCLLQPDNITKWLLSGCAIFPFHQKSLLVFVFFFIHLPIKCCWLSMNKRRKKRSYFLFSSSSVSFPPVNRLASSCSICA